MHKGKGECYTCGKIGHYTKNCHLKKLAKSNVVTSQVDSISEEGWGVETSLALVEPN